MMDLKSFVRDIPDFPIPGVLFRDISPLLQTPRAFSEALDRLVSHADMTKIDHFVGIESRGFILAAALAARHTKGFVPLRKAGKLPPPVESLQYTLEYGSAQLELHRGQGRVLIVDDVLATGGTLAASIQLCEQAGYGVENVAVLIDLQSLNDMRFRGSRIHSVLRYE